MQKNWSLADFTAIFFPITEIIDCKTKDCIYEKHLPLHIPGRLWQDALTHGIGICTYWDNKLIAGTPPDSYMELEARITKLPIQYREDFGTYVLEVIPKNVDKTFGLKHLLKILDIKNNEMVCCGDSFNDIRMIQYAGVGVAMKNGQEKLKAVANYVTKNDNDHDGIVEVIEHFFPN